MAQVAWVASPCSRALPCVYNTAAALDSIEARLHSAHQPRLNICVRWCIGLLGVSIKRRRHHTAFICRGGALWEASAILTKKSLHTKTCGCVCVVQCVVCREIEIYSERESEISWCLLIHPSTNRERSISLLYLDRNDPTCLYIYIYIIWYTHGRWRLLYKHILRLIHASASLILCAE